MHQRIAIQAHASAQRQRPRPEEGHQQNVIELMKTRAELYDRIGYHAFEQKLDALFAAGKK